MLQDNPATDALLNQAAQLQKNDPQPSAPPAHATVAAAETPVDSLLDEAEAAERNDAHIAHQLIGEHQVTQEQERYGAQIAETLGDVGHRIYDVGRGAVSGVIHAAGELGSAATGMLASGFVDHTGMWQRVAEGTTDPELKKIALNALKKNEAMVRSITDAPQNAADAIAPQTDTAGGSLAQGLTQFLAAFMPATRLAKVAELPALGRAVANTVAGGFSQAAAFNPDDPRLSNLIQEHPALRNPVTEFLASKPGDTEAEGRFKNFIEGTGLSAISEGAVEGITALFKGMRASGAVAETTKALSDAKPTEIPEAAPAATDADTAETPAVAPAMKPYEPPALAKADTAEPVAAHTEPPAGEATASTEATPTAPVFDPAAVASQFIQIDPEKAQTVLGYIADGRYSEIPGVLEDTHRTIPWDTLSDGANLKGLFNAVEGTFGDMIRQAHGVGTVSQDTIVQLAKDIGGDVSSLSRTFGNLTGNGGLAAQITAGYNIMVASARRLKDLAEAAHALNPETDAGKQAILEFHKQLELHAAIVGQVRQSSAEIGRALYAHRSLKASSAVALQNVTELAGTVLGPKAMKQFIRNVGDAKDLAAVTKAADAVRGGRFMAVVKEIAQNGMLSGFPTQIANLGGNTVNAGIKLAERYLAGVIGQVRGVFMPDVEHATVRAAVAHSVGAYAGLRDSFPLMVKALATEQSVSAAGRPLIRAVYRETEGRTGLDLTLSQVINRVGQAIRYPGRLMGAIDNLNMGIGRQADLEARIYTQAATEADAKGLAGDARDSFLDARMADLRANPPPSIVEKSIDTGLYQSFQEAARTRFGDLISKGLNSHPLVKLIVAPFVHRPLNMLRQSIMDYTPFGLLSANQRALLKQGNADTDVALARMLIGTGAVLTSYEMAASGKVTGARLGSRNTEALDEIPKHAIRIGGRWFNYNRVDPLGLWLAIGSELHETLERHYDPNNPDAVNDLATLARAAIQVTGQAALDKSFMQSADQIITMLGEKNPVRASALVQRFIASNAGKFVPFSGALRGAAQAMDTTERATGGDGWASIWDSVKAGLPTLSQELAPRRDVLGRPIERPAGTTAWWNPFGGSRASDDPLDRELSQVAVNVQVPPRQLHGIAMDAKSYDELIRTATQAPLFPRATDLEGYLRMLVQSDLWKSLGTTDDHGITARSKLVQEAVDTAYDYGRTEFMAAHPNFQRAMMEQAMEQAKHYQAQ